MGDEVYRFFNHHKNLLHMMLYTNRILDADERRTTVFYTFSNVCCSIPGED